MAKGQARHQKLQGSGGIHIACIVRYRWQWCRTARGRARHKTLQFQGAAGSLILLSSICSKGSRAGQGRARHRTKLQGSGGVNFSDIVGNRTARGRARHKTLQFQGAAGSVILSSSVCSKGAERPRAEPAIELSSREQRGQLRFGCRSLVLGRQGRRGHWLQGSDNAHHSVAKLAKRLRSRD